MKNKTQVIIIGVLCVAIAICCGILTYKYLDKKNADKKAAPQKTEEPAVINDKDYNMRNIKAVNGSFSGVNY